MQSNGTGIIIQRVEMSKYACRKMQFKIAMLGTTFSYLEPLIYRCKIGRSW